MAARRHEISLRALKTFHEWALLSNCFMMNFKLQNAAQRRFVFVECYVVNLLSWVAWLSRTFSTFLDNQLGHVYISARVGRFASVTEIIKYVENLLLFACLVFSRTLCQKGIKVPTEFFWRTKFFPTSWSAVLSQAWRRSILKLAESARYLKFKWEFVIIGRGCLVLLKFKSSLCWRMLYFKVL